MGLWLVLFLIEHLLVNSQAALLLGDSGKGFVDLVNGIHNLPYLQVIELVLLGVPFAVHMVWGIKRLFTAKANSYKSDGSKPSLRDLPRNHAYTWQRITSWILVFGVIGHVAKFRFIDYPVSVSEGSKSSYFVSISLDNGLYTVADRLGVKLYDQKALDAAKQEMEERAHEATLLEAAETIRKEPAPQSYDAQKALILDSAQKYKAKSQWTSALLSFPLKPGEVVAEANDFGTASLLTVRDTFKYPIYVALYTIFVLATCFHAFNGLWTFLITWGVILKMSAQRSMVTVCYAIMAIIIFLGLVAIWGTYWLNLKY